MQVVQANGPLLPFPGIPGGQRVGYFEVSFNNAGPSRLASVGLAIPQYAQHHLGWVKGCALARFGRACVCGVRV